MPRFTTTLILIGASPAAAAASMPSSTLATGKSTSFIARNVASSSASRLTVTRVRPASTRLRAFFASSEPLVVSVRSRSPSFASISTSRSTFRRSSGSPPVRRILATPRSHEDPGEARDLLEREQVGVRQELVVRIEDILRHAVDAAEIAAVGDRDAQVVQPATAGVGDGPRCDRRAAGGGAHENVRRVAACIRCRGGADVGYRDDRGHALGRRAAIRMKTQSTMLAERMTRGV